MNLVPLAVGATSNHTVPFLGTAIVAVVRPVAADTTASGRRAFGVFTMIMNGGVVLGVAGIAVGAASRPGALSSPGMTRPNPTATTTAAAAASGAKALNRGRR